MTKKQNKTFVYPKKNPIFSMNYIKIATVDPKKILKSQLWYLKKIKLNTIDTRYELYFWVKKYKNDEFVDIIHYLY